MQTQNVEIDKVIPYARNPRQNKEAVNKVAASLKEFGWQQPIVVDKEYVIIVGHTRLEAARKLGHKEVPIVVADNLTAQQVKAYRIADNKTGEFAEWDLELLTGEIEELQNDGFSIELTGFDDFSFMDEFKDTEDEKAERDATEDNVPEEPEKPVTQEGDVWILGEHRLMCGDSTDEKCVSKLVSYFKDETKHCISDPPYGIAYSPDSDKYGMIKNDDTFLDYIGLAKKYTDGFFFMWTGYQVVDEWTKRIKDEFEKVTNMIIWHKGGGGMGDCLKTLAQDFEIGLVVNRGNHIQSSRTGALWEYQKDKRKQFLASKKKDELVEALDSLIDGEVVWKVKKDTTSQYLHPTQKPVEVNQRALFNFTKKGDAVIDLFLGSGSNLIACQNLQRKCGGMEIDPIYCDVIIKRWQDYTGKQAYKEDTEEKYDDLKDKE